jgi:hypothetical protein
MLPVEEEKLFARFWFVSEIDALSFCATVIVEPPGCGEGADAIGAELMVCGSIVLFDDVDNQIVSTRVLSVRSGRDFEFWLIFVETSDICCEINIYGDFRDMISRLFYLCSGNEALRGCTSNRICCI